MEKQITYMKNRFSIGDKIVETRFNEVIAQGEIVKGPFEVERVDHYQVRWTWKEGQLPDKEYPYRDTELISDLASRKYRYELA